jgi:seryl-tRNA synthetase
LEEKKKIKKMTTRIEKLISHLKIIEKKEIEEEKKEEIIEEIKTKNEEKEFNNISFKMKEMIKLLEHDNHEMRREFKHNFSKDELFIPQYDISIKESRELALKRLKLICDNNYVSVLDFKNNPHRIFASHELASIVDGSTATKMTVFFIFIIYLGTIQFIWRNSFKIRNKKTS